MSLSAVKVQQAKPKDKPYKLLDGDNLFLLVHPRGSKYWRYRYSWQGKEKTLALGTYPDISLAEARERRNEARKLKAHHINPAEHKKEQKREVALQHSNTFEVIAREWIEIKTTWTAYYRNQVLQRLEKDIFPKIGHRPISALTAIDLLKIAKAIEARNALEVAHRAVQVCGQIFQYGIITGRADRNPAVDLRGALKTAPKTHYAHLSHNELPEFIEKLEAYDGSLQTKLAIKLLLLTFVRTGELRGARWSEIDLDRKEWRIPAERMKMRSPHIVPLSKQAIAVLTILKRLNGHREFVFPSPQSPRQCISNNTMLYALYTMGFKNKTTIHGLRATASTILNENGFNRDIIERQLAHQERNRVRAAYDHSEHLAARREMMQWWGYYLDKASSQSLKKAA